VSDQEALQREAGARIARWLAAVDRAPPGSFTTVADFAAIPEQARAESYYWCDEVLSPDVSPHDAPGVRHGHRRATGSSPDLICHAYTAKGLGITVIEGRSFLLVEVDRESVDVLALPPAARAAAIHRVAGALLRTPRDGRALSFRVPDEIDEGARFSTDEGADPLLLAAWSDRVEGGVRGGRIFFLCYKKRAQEVGLAGDHRWFDDPAPRVRRPRRRAAR
jgi:hypothetical protein